MTALFDPPVYLDFAAGTPLHPEVFEQMRRVMTSNIGNPSSIHAYGRTAKAAIDSARDSVAALLHCESAEVVFTSGGTEADNLALFGSANNAKEGRNKIVISAVEHHAVLHSALRLACSGFRVEQIPVDSNGALDLKFAEKAIDDSTVLVSVMLANNETGVIYPVKKIARMAHSAGALVHTDAVQAAGILPINPRELEVDMISISAHKFYGPQGVGALYVKRGVKLCPVVFGGAQERERRAGTENVPGITGMGTAATIALRDYRIWLDAINSSRDAFQQEFENCPDVMLHASQTERLPSILNYAVTGVDGELLVMRMDQAGVAISTGAACASGSTEPSHVLTAMGLSEDEVKSSIRVSFGRASNPEACKKAASAIALTAQSMRERTTRRQQRVRSS